MMDGVSRSPERCTPCSHFFPFPLPFPPPFPLPLPLPPPLPPALPPTWTPTPTLTSALAPCFSLPAAQPIPGSFGFLSHLPFFSFVQPTTTTSTEGRAA